MKNSALGRSVLLVGVLLTAASALAIDKSPLRVLYVGGSANWEKEQFASPDEMQTDVARRMRSFEDMLRRYFAEVTVIPATEYKQEISQKFDVTVMDGTPEPLEARRVVRDASGRVTEAISARYFTEDFNRPVVVIGELGEKLGRRIGLKFDWYCLCLDAHAHGMRPGHAIFRGPFPVKLTMEERPTPDDAFHYAYFFDQPIPKTLPMWRVQTKGYQTDRNFRIGMVARPWGFEDSPDAEFISSGVCQKGLDAVAIARHGNFFCWGFAASPEFMTEEAQTVLANAISYIAKFDGQGLLARKYNDRRATKHWVRELKYLASEPAFLQRQELERKHGERMAREKASAIERKARGEKLTMIEDLALKYNHRTERTTFDQYLAQSRSHRELYDKHGTDVAAYHRYYDENLDWFYAEPAPYKLTIDEDARSLGIANTDPRILEKAIALWEKGQDVEKARRILNRYTLLSYPSVRDWREWYDANRERLFFTQAGGFVFMVNSRDPAVEGNDYSAKAVAAAAAGLAAADTNDRQPVSISAAVAPTPAGGKQILVKMKVHPGYHTYSHVAPSDAFTATSIELELPSGYRGAGELKRPSYRPYNESGTTGIYTGEVVFAQELLGDGTGEAKVKITYQCCDPHICFPVAEEVLTVKL
jgi:hypothetical protein